MSLNFSDLDMIKEVVNIGTGNAATSLSNLIKQKIKISVPTVEIQEFKDISSQIGGPDNIVIAILIKISGDISGLMLYIMSEESACALSNKLLKRNRKKISEFSDLEYSMVKEIGNILMSSYLTALSKIMGYKISQSLPYLSVDMAQSILSIPAIELGKFADKSLFIESKFMEVSESSQLVNGYFMLIPNVYE